LALSRNNQAVSHIFISYVREDSDRINRLKASLDAAGVHTWIDHENIRVGENWPDAVRKAVEGADFFIACYSKSFVVQERTEMWEELRQARDELRKRPPKPWFLPVLLDNVEVPDLRVSAGERLGLYQSVPLYEGDWAAGVERLLREIKPGSAAQQRERRVLHLPPLVSASASTPQPASEPQQAQERQALPEPKPSWIVQSTRQVREALPGAEVVALAVDPSQLRLMTAGGNVTQFWGLPRLEPLFSRPHEAKVMAAALGVSGSCVATASSDRIVRLWDSVPDSPELELDHRDTGSWHFPPKMVFSASGEFLATGYLTQLRVWDRASGQRIQLEASPKVVTALAFGPFSRLLAMGDVSGTVQLCDVKTGQLFPRKAHPGGSSSRSVDQVLFSPDGARLVSVGREGSLRAWDVESGSEEEHLCRDGVHCVAFGPSPATLAGGGKDGSVHVWETDTGRELFRADLPSAITKLAFSPDGEILATISNDGTAHVWAIRSGEKLSLGKQQYRVRQIAFVPDGNLLATAGIGHSEDIRLWTGVPK
jgi:WD40 repeat protein